MRTILSFFLICLVSSTLIFNDAFAKRFGRGRSFGTQRSASSYSNTARPSNSLLGQTNKKANTSKWGGMLGGLLGGLLIGGLLSSLFMGNGLASGLLTWLILGAIILFLVKMFRRKTPSMQGNAQANDGKSSFTDNLQSFAQNNWGQSNQAAQTAQPSQLGAFNNASNSNLMASSDTDEDFLREAKVKFIRLQAAYDQQNFEDIREFTSPEVLAEIQMQFQEQAGAVNQTEVVSLEAELLGTEFEGDIQTSSVKFTGFIKENSDKAEPLNEIWHFQKIGEFGQWIVSGVQQIKPW